MYMELFNTEDNGTRNIDRKYLVIDATYTSLISMIHADLETNYLQKVHVLEKDALCAVQELP